MILLMMMMVFRWPISFIPCLHSWYIVVTPLLLLLFIVVVVVIHIVIDDWWWYYGDIEWVMLLFHCYSILDDDCYSFPLMFDCYSLIYSYFSTTLLFSIYIVHCIIDDDDDDPLMTSMMMIFIYCCWCCCCCYIPLLFLTFCSFCYIPVFLHSRFYIPHSFCSSHSRCILLFLLPVGTPRFGYDFTTLRCAVVPPFVPVPRCVTAHHHTIYMLFWVTLTPLSFPFHSCLTTSFPHIHSLLTVFIDLSHHIPWSPHSFPPPVMIILL